MSALHCSSHPLMCESGCMAANSNEVWIKVFYKRTKGMLHLPLFAIITSFRIVLLLLLLRLL